MHPEVLSALLTAIAAIITGLLGFSPVKAWFENRALLKHKITVLQGMARIRDTYRTIHQVVEETSAERVILFAGHNNGGFPRMQCPFWVSGIYAYSTRKDKAMLIAQYTNLTVDQSYIQMLIDSEREGCVVIDAATMADSQLKSYYDVEKVTHALIFYLSVLEKKFMYLSVAKYTPEPFSQADITKIKLFVNTLKGLV